MKRPSNKKALRFAEAIQRGLYIRPDGIVLLAAGNLTEKDERGTVTIDRNCYDLAGKSVDNILDKKDAKISSQTITLDVCAKDFRLVEIRQG